MLIAISQRNDKNKHGDRIDNLENNYINYFERFGIKLLPIPNTTKDVSYYFENFPVSAIILTGGNDVNPELYGEKPDEGLAVSKERDNTERRMLEIAVNKKLPVFGFCRGMQFINVFFKGKLINDIKDHVGANHVAITHTIKIINEEAKKVLGDEIGVNSYHNQGITPDTLSPELTAFATADDVVEGFYHPSLPIAGVEWHPERKSPDEAANEKLVKAFLNRELFWK